MKECESLWYGRRPATDWHFIFLSLIFLLPPLASRTVYSSRRRKGTSARTWSMATVK